MQIELWHLILLLLAWFGACWAVFKMLMAGLDTRFGLLSKRLDTSDEAREKTAEQLRNIERDLLLFKAELPVQYVRREDYVTAIATIMTKLDAMAIRFENLILKKALKEGQEP